MRRTLSLALPVLLASGLAGCMDGNSDRYPSLLPRPIESQGFDEPTPPPPQPVAPDAALDKAMADADAQLDSATKDFTAAAQRAEALVAVARGVPAGSDAWLDAQVALGELDQRREAANALLTGLQERSTERGLAGQPPYPALEALIARVDALARQQSARITSLNAALSH
ncbi:hypothetical protein [Sphingomonas sp.]|uniref:hypothetical protein n=1 Tax=Sphingomonas sp. TaxID=28214 RepID=UPI001B08C0B5|nr:hypothetical protein [Sphingomonas sp.]MBO9713766.1 hypothetical protein [Sphingomonas sp.]